MPVTPSEFGLDGFVFPAAGASCDYPAEADVRVGVTYGTGTYTGTLVVYPSTLAVSGYGVATDLAELFDRIKAALVAVTGLTEDYVFLTLEDPVNVYEQAPADRFLTIRFGNFAGDRPVIWGAGTTLTAFKGRFQVTLHCRVSTDQSLRAYGLFTSDPGILALWLKVLGCLQQFTPIRNGNTTQGLTTEPLQPVSFEFPVRQPPQGWGRLDAAFTLPFVHRLS